MKKNYVKPSMQAVEVEEFAMLCSSSYEKPHERVYIDRGDFDGCLPVIVVLLVVVFGIGAGVSYCI